MRILRIVAPLVFHAGVLGYAVLTARMLKAELVQARRLYEQQESDHGELVKKTIRVNDMAYRLDRLATELLSR